MRFGHAFLWEHVYSYKGLELVQLLGQLGVFLTQGDSARSQIAESGDGLEKIEGGEPVWKNYTLAACSAHAMANESTPGSGRHSVTGLQARIVQLDPAAFTEGPYQLDLQWQSMWTIPALFLFLRGFCADGGRARACESARV